ncbi:hypothetical protein QOT17_007204 [Balamuthia mandrillaris]
MIGGDRLEYRERREMSNKAGLFSLHVVSFLLTILASILLIADYYKYLSGRRYAPMAEFHIWLLVAGSVFLQLLHLGLFTWRGMMAGTVDLLQMLNVLSASVWLNFFMYGVGVRRQWESKAANVFLAGSLLGLISLFLLLVVNSFAKYGARRQALGYDEYQPLAAGAPARD